MTKEMEIQNNIKLTDLGLFIVSTVWHNMNVAQYEIQFDPFQIYCPINHNIFSHFIVIILYDAPEICILCSPKTISKRQNNAKQKTIDNVELHGSH